MPQILMLNHAAWCNGERHKSDDKSANVTVGNDSDPLVEVGSTKKQFSQMTETERDAYYMNLFS